MRVRSRGYTFKDEKLESLTTEIKSAIAMYETRNHVQRSETIKLSGMSSTAFYKAWNNPELFRIRQLYDIYEGLRVPAEARRYV